MNQPTVRILGTHGVPAAYGGFETAAENVACYLRDQGWRVVVYCQVDGSGHVCEDTWNGIERVRIPVSRDGWRGTGTFDLLAVSHAARHRDLCLTFGYNTAFLNMLQRVRGIPNVINMDGIEWSRAKWGPALKSVLWINERIATHTGDHLIADHPSIAAHLRRKARPGKLTTIAYGAHTVDSAPIEPVLARGLEPGTYLTLICRPVPENSILELVQAFSAARRGWKLAILGDYRPDEHPYDRAVMTAASDEVMFLGAEYDHMVVTALRFHSAAYLHGHTVGGTNPSLVEAMAAGNPVIAHDNEYNRWVAGAGAVYFRTSADAKARLDEVLAHPTRRAELAAASRARHAQEFTWHHIAAQYEALLRRYLPAG